MLFYSTLKFQNSSYYLHLFWENNFFSFFKYKKFGEIEPKSLKKLIKFTLRFYFSISLGKNDQILPGKKTFKQLTVFMKEPAVLCTVILFYFSRSLKSLVILFYFSRSLKSLAATRFFSFSFKNCSSEYEEPPW